MLKEKIYDVKFPKDSLYSIAIISSAANIGLIITLIFFQPGDHTGKRFAFSLVLLFCFILGYLVPLWVYSLNPYKMNIQKNKVTFHMRIKGTKELSRANIHDLTEMKSPMSGEIGYGLNYNVPRTQDAITLDKISGKAVWDWYHSKGEWKKEQ